MDQAKADRSAGGAIFVSYRRDDTSGYAGRLYDSLVQEFGKSRLFMDIDTISPGADFVERVEEAVNSSAVLIAMIGAKWEGSLPDGTRRIENANDFVRLEIAAALKRGIVVIPVLVRGATVPSPLSLPDDLKALARRNALGLDDARWSFDVARLITAIRDVPAMAEPRRTLEERLRSKIKPVLALVGAMLLIVATAGAVAHFRGEGKSSPTPTQGGRPTTSSGPQIPSRLVYEAALDHPTTGWPVSKPGQEGCVFAFEDSAYLIQVTVPKKYLSYFCASSYASSANFTNFSDVRAEVDLRWKEVHLPALAGLQCRGTGTSSGYNAAFSPNGDWQIKRYDPHKASVLSSGNDPFLATQLGQTRHVSFICLTVPAGVFLSLTVDDHFVGSVVDVEPLPPGSVSLVASNYTKHSIKVEFDQLQIFGPPA